MAAQRGGQAFIEKPASAEEILNTIAQVLQQQRHERPRVMIVDDDIHILKVLQTLLSQWEIEVILLAEPQHFWQVLETKVPDLLILDLNMPDYSGIDLCRAVRTASLWHDLPIVFLSSHSDRQTIRQIFAAGADDYLSKPIVEVDLQMHIFSRLDRSRISRQAADFDGLTGIYTRRRGIQSLTQLIRLATRNHQSLCLAILDLDLFKQVNDCYGHGIGDLVLKKFGELLRQTFRSEDVTMRWGGEEFVVGLYGANSQQSIERLHKFLEIWRQQEFMVTATESFSLTFSAGVVEYLQDSSSLELLYQRMDQALYQAKVTGRNKIILASNCYEK
ncbi:MAG: diguanylate cyclase [Pseudanabaena sp.]